MTLSAIGILAVFPTALVVLVACAIGLLVLGGCTQDRTSSRTEPPVQSTTPSQSTSPSTTSTPRSVPSHEGVPTQPLNQNTQTCGSGESEQPPCPPCAKYVGYDGTRDVETYNCAGLSHRTYTFIGDVNVVKSMLGTPVPCSGRCQRCQIKHWLWEYDIHLEDDGGTRLTADSRDFHTVGGRCDHCGNDPTDVYTKNGARPVFGPGTGPSFRPPARDQARSNNRHNTPVTDSHGRPIWKVRTNYVETCYCLDCVC